MPSMVRQTTKDRASAALQYMGELQDALDLAIEQIAPVGEAGPQLDGLRSLQNDAEAVEDAIRQLLVGDSRLRLLRPVPNDCERVVEFGAAIDKLGTPSEGMVFKCVPDQRVIAPVQMRVIKCRGENRVWGKRIIAEVVGNERYVIVLAHLSRVDVDDSDVVEEGSQVGAAGQTGNANFVQMLFALADTQDTSPLPNLKAPDVIGGSWIDPWPYTVRNPEDAHLRYTQNAEGAT